uniref:Uncharacterized protein n=1 Tax=Cannabis sativa TaxID=3483 RepID=A0A803PSY6_CANSA
MHLRRPSRGNCELFGLGVGGEGVNPPPPNWEEMCAAMQEVIRQQGDQIQELREQRAQPAPNFNSDPLALLGNEAMTEYATKLDWLAKIALDDMATESVIEANFIQGSEEHIARDVIIAANNQVLSELMLMQLS